MRYALISDIHANLEALEVVVEDIDEQNINEIICLGDIVGYGANPNECIELVKKKCSIVLQGNHDAAAIEVLSTHHFNIHAKIAIEWTTQELKKEHKEWLYGLPLISSKENMTVVHATPYEPNMWYYITSLEEAAFNFKYFNTDLCFVGHTHIPIIIGLEGEEEIYVHQDTYINFKDDGELKHRYLINVGSVGQPRDRNPKACYAILDTEAFELNYRRVAYNIDKAQQKMRKIRMPDFLITRLEDGR